MASNTKKTAAVVVKKEDLANVQASVKHREFLMESLRKIEDELAEVVPPPKSASNGMQ